MLRFRWPLLAASSLFLTFAIALSIAPQADAEQLVPNNIKRIFAPQNENLYINNLDDKRVDVDIAVIDNGIDLDHPDLNVVAGVDCAGANSKEDCEENTPGLTGSEGDPGSFIHGTQVAGRAAAIDNSFGVVGVAPGARLWAVNASGDGFDQSPVLFDLDAYVSAVNWVTENADEIEVVALSLVCPETPEEGLVSCVGDAGANELEAAIEESISAGVVYVAGAFHVDKNVSEFFPQSFPDVIVVSHIADFDGEAGYKKENTPYCEGSPSGYQGKDDTLATGSNWGQLVDFAVPGFCIPDTRPGGGYGPGQHWSASSSAYPHAVGAAALLASTREMDSASDVLDIQAELIGSGNKDWTDTALEKDNEHEPLLDLHDEGVFAPKMNAGTAWLIKPAPNAGELPNNRLTGVSCTSATFCLATANLTSGSTWAYGLAWNGSSWTPTAGAPFQDNGGVELSGVSCTSSTFCIGVGSETEPDGKVLNIAVRWDGTKWSRQTTPSAGNGAFPTRLTGVSCTSATFCLAAANVVVSGATWAYGLVWNGSTWQETAGAPNKDNGGVELSGVSCTSSTFCIGVGSETEPDGKVLNIGVRWNGTQWSRETIPSAGKGTVPTRLTGVSCTSVTFCLATANLVSGGTSYAYGVVWNGSTWQETAGAPYKENAGVELRGVSCTSSTSCVGVGSQTKASNVFTLAVRWDGTQWAREETPNEDETSSNQLTSVSCVSTCKAVGSYATGSGPKNLAVHAP